MEDVRFGSLTTRQPYEGLVRLHVAEADDALRVAVGLCHQLVLALVADSPSARRLRHFSRARRQHLASRRAAGARCRAAGASGGCSAIRTAAGRWRARWRRWVGGGGGRWLACASGWRRHKPCGGWARAVARGCLPLHLPLLCGGLQQRPLQCNPPPPPRPLCIMMCMRQ